MGRANGGEAIWKGLYFNFSNMVCKVSFEIIALETMDKKGLEGSSISKCSMGVIHVCIWARCFQVLGLLFKESKITVHRFAKEAR